MQSYPFEPLSPVRLTEGVLAHGFSPAHSPIERPVVSKPQAPVEPADEPAPRPAAVRWTNHDTDWALDDDGAGAAGAGSLTGGSEMASATGTGVSKAKRAQSPGMGELTFSLTGSYSRSPSRSQHKRAASASFGSAPGRSEGVVIPLGSTDPAYSQVFLRKGPLPALGKQHANHHRSAPRAVLGLGTRDEAQKLHPAFAPGLGEMPEVGPGRYEAPSSVGRQSVSMRHSAAHPIIGSAPRFTEEFRSITPGPVYTPKLDYRSSAYREPAIQFGTGERRPEIMPKTPAAVYKVRTAIGKHAPKPVIGKGLRPPNLNTGCGVDVMYTLDGKFNGFQSRSVAASFPRSKRF